MNKRKDPESIVLEIKCKTKSKYSTVETILIVLEGLRGEESIAEYCPHDAPPYPAY